MKLMKYFDQIHPQTHDGDVLNERGGKIKPKVSLHLWGQINSFYSETFQKVFDPVTESPLTKELTKQILGTDVSLLTTRLA